MIQPSIMAGPEPKAKKADGFLPAGRVMDFARCLAAQRRVFAPVKRREVMPKGKEKYSYLPLNQAPGDTQIQEEVVLEYPITTLDPKKFFFPRKQTLMRFLLKAGVKAEPVYPESEPTALLGLHPCDIHGLQLLDLFFLSDYRDEQYARRRENLFVVGTACLTPCTEHSFCGSMRTFFVNEGYDLFLTPVEGGYAVTVGSKAGQEVLDSFDSIGRVNKDVQKMLAEREKSLLQSFNETVAFDRERIPEILRSSYNDPIWDEEAKRCLACGACNMVCQTCYCYDVQHDVSLDLTQGENYRVWDGCMLREFAEVGHGENFREKRSQRLRHRIYRKGLYLHERYGKLFCVGCGRCASSCLANISPKTIFSTLEERHGH